MKRRSVVSTALVGAAALVVAACGGTTKNTTTPTTAATGSGSSTTCCTAPKPLAAAPGFDPTTNTIHLGVITPLTGAAAIIGKPLTAGTQAWFNYINSTGGIAGKYKVQLDIEDSQYVAQTAVQDYNKIKDGDVMIAQLLGTPETDAVLPLLRQDNIVAAPASLDAAWVHDPNLLPVGAPYQFQMINGAYYVYNTLDMKTQTVCSFIQHDTYGQAGEQGLDFAAQHLGFTVKNTQYYTAGATDVSAQIQQLKSNGCQVVYLVSTPDITIEALSKAATLGYTPQWVGASPTYVGALAKSALGPYMTKYYIQASEGTEWGNTSVKGMADLISRTSSSQAPDIYYVFGYYQAWAVTDLLNKAVQLGSLSRQGIINALDNLGTLSFDGLTGSYSYGSSPADRVPPRETSIFKVDATKPGGLAVVITNYTSDLAKQYTLPNG
jgi:ABC-type branched-subunit amino acid transport system substrate-binding protein